MLDKLKSFVFGILVKKYTFGWLADLYKKADGYKTQLLSVAAGLVLLLGFVGVMDMNTAFEIAEKLASFAGLTFVEKLAKYKSVIEKAQALAKEPKQP